MKTKFKDVEETFKGFLKLNKLSDKKFILKTADARLGNLCGIYKNTQSGGIANVTSLYTYSELVAWMDGYIAYKYNNPFKKLF